MKNFIKGLVVGLILASATVFASNAITIEVEKNYANVQLEGNSVESDNFYHDGKTYVWIRDVANMLNKDIDWNEEAKTANIVEKKAEVSKYVPIKTDDRVAIKVGKQEITVQEIKAIAYTVLTGETSKDKKDAVEKACDNLINISIAINNAEAEGIMLPANIRTDYEAQVNAILNSDKSADFIAFLENGGLTDKLYVDIMELLEYEGAYTKSLVTSGAMPEKLAKDYYNKNKNQLQTVTAKHILIKDGDDNAKKIANDVYKMLVNGADFDEMAKKYSTDPGLAQNPDGYTFKKGEMIAEFENAAFTQDVKGLYAPVRSEFGYHIIFVTDRKIPTYDECTEECKKIVFPDWYKTYMEDLRKKADVKIDEEIVKSISI